MKFSGTKAAGHDREHAGVARLALGILDREAQRLVGGEEQEHDQEGDQRRLVPHPPVTPRGLGPDRAPVIRPPTPKISDMWIAT